MTDDELLPLMQSINRQAKRIPPGVRAIVNVVEGAWNGKVAELQHDVRELRDENTKLWGWLESEAQRSGRLQRRVNDLERELEDVKAQTRRSG